MAVVKGPENAYARPGFLIKQAQAVLHAEMARALAAHGVTLSQYAVLTALDQEPGLSNAQLARRAFITPQSMSENLRELEQHAWVARHRHPDHGRILQAELTEQGRELLRHCEAAVTLIEDRMLADLDPDQRRHLVTALTTCIAALSPSR
ncbi:MAG TPA: MarR family transcriptional regulator [Actinocrinis sp.]|nr:MarR family transcriptional regulator [Actinocrinis sp.]